jgi:hypothetical protein
MTRPLKLRVQCAGTLTAGDQVVACDDGRIVTAPDQNGIGQALESAGAEDCAQVRFPIPYRAKNPPPPRSQFAQLIANGEMRRLKAAEERGRKAALAEHAAELKTKNKKKAKQTIAEAFQANPELATTPPDTLIRQLHIKRTDGLWALRQLKDEGKYNGYKAPRRK